MPRMQILTPAEYAAFETPPIFTSVERKQFFDLSQSLLSLLSTFRTPANQICFVLALGYFKATKRFFARQFHEADAAYVARQLGFFPGMFDSRVLTMKPQRGGTASSFWITWASSRLMHLPSSISFKRSAPWSVPKCGQR